MQAAATTLWLSCDDAGCGNGSGRNTSATTVAGNDEEQQGEGGQGKGAGSGSLKLQTIEPEPEPELEPVHVAGDMDDEDNFRDSIVSVAGELVSLTGTDTVASIEAVLSDEYNERCRFLTLTTIFLLGTLIVRTNKQTNKRTNEPAVSSSFLVLSFFSTCMLTLSLCVLTFCYPSCIDAGCTNVG